MPIPQLRAKIRIRTGTDRWISILLWRHWLRTKITIPWPQGWTPQDHLGNSVLSSDPNDWYREWLEANVGPQGWSWDWRVGSGTDPTLPDTLWVKFRDPKMASWFALVWG